MRPLFFYSRTSMRKFLVLLCFSVGLCSCAHKYVRRGIGAVDSSVLPEVSGIVPSKYHPGHYWVHNDGGHAPALYLIDSTGAVRSSVIIGNAVNRDWEDLASGWIGGKSYLYVGDIGDNTAVRANVQIYRLEEPQDIQNVLKVPSEVMHLSYAEGSRDAETLMYDPHTGELIIVTKRELRVHAYAFPFTTDTLTVSSRGRVGHALITGGDINHHGDVIIKNYGHVFLWPASRGVSAVDRLVLCHDESIKYRRETQGEAICWNRSGKGFITISERQGRASVPVYEYQLQE